MSAPAGEYSTAGATSGWQGIISLRTKPMDRPDLLIIVPRQMNSGCSKVITVKIISFVGRIGANTFSAGKR
jgi:hypothetical protein